MPFLKRTIQVAYVKYKRHDTHIPITLLRTQESFEGSGNDPSLGWGPFAQGRFALDPIGGEHATIFEAEHIPELARQVRAILRDSQPTEDSDASQTKNRVA